MKLFEKRRVSAYFQSGQLKKEKDAPRRFWLLKLAIAMESADASSCEESILSNFRQIEARANAVDQIAMGSVDAVLVRFFEDRIAAEPTLVLDACFLSGLSMTHKDGITELWMTVEHDLTDKLHEWVRRNIFTRFHVEFLPMQRKLGETPEASVGERIVEKIARGAGDPNHPLQKLADRDGTTTTLSAGGRTLAVFEPKGKKAKDV